MGITIVLRTSTSALVMELLLITVTKLEHYQWIGPIYQSIQMVMR